jgi:hypothetical protein
MRKLEDLDPEKVYSHVKRGRTKKDPIVITNVLGESKARLKISATQEDWETLWAFFLDKGFSADEETLARLGIAFRNSFLIPYISEITMPKDDLQKENIEEIKMLAGFLHAFFKQYLVLSQADIPCVSLVLRGDYFPKHIDADDPTACTAYCMQMLLSEDLDWLNIRPFIDINEVEKAQDLQSFYITYIQDGQKLIRNATPKMIVDFWAYSTPVELGESTGPVTKIVEDIFRIFWKMSHAFLYHPDNSYVPTQIKRDRDILAIYKIFLQIYPFLQSTSEVLQNIRLHSHSRTRPFPYEECSFDVCSFLDCGTDRCAYKDTKPVKTD